MNFRNSIKNRPLISVIMSVYNGEAFLREAMESVLSQSYDNFEFIIVDDCSSDNSVKIIESYDDSRIILLKNKTNQKLPTSLNRAIMQAEGEYIIRMDADDVCLPGRFIKQVSFMEKHKNIDIASGRYFLLDDSGIHFAFDTHPNSPDFIKCTFVFYSVLIHPNTIIRRKVFEKLKYDPAFSVAQDLDLWIRASEKFRIAKMKSTTLLYRIHNKQASCVKHRQQIDNEMRIKRPLLEKLFDTVTQDMEIIHTRVSMVDGKYPNKEVVNWLLELKKANEKKKIYPLKEFEQVLIRMGFTNGMRSSRKLEMMGLLCRKFGILKTLQMIWRILLAFVAEGLRLPGFLAVKVRRGSHRPAIDL